MDPKEPLDAPSTRHDLDPYQQAPQVLKDIYKSWTGAIPRNCKEGYLDTASLSMPGVDSIPGWVVQPEFVRFVQGIALSPGFHRGDPDPNPRQTRIATGVEKRSLYWLDFGPDGPGYSELEKYSIASPWRQNKAENDLLDFLSTAKYGAFSFKNIPGLTIIPGLFPPIVQQTLLECLFHRELSRPENKTNLHLHYNISYPQQHDTFFSTTGASTSFTPKNLNENKALSNATVLEKSLRWITLGGQYDWTKKEYPKETPPEFPDDIARLVGSIFTDMKPEAAIVNLYSAKDKLSLHRDVSEEADRGLVSISLGCSCLFVIGFEDKNTGELHHQTLRLNSGDVVYMAEESRFAWHGVPQILPDTCPEYLRDWPGPAYPEWRGWMSRKRINLNIRQMYKGR